MTSRLVMIWRQWPRPVRLSAGLVGGAVGVAAVYVALAGTPRPVQPSNALFEPVTIQQTLSASRPQLSSFDFIFRPIFALTRKPPVQPDLLKQNEAAIAEAEAAASATTVESIDGVNLLGIFGSGEVEGIIIRLDNGERERMVVGDVVKGWTLQRVGPRHAEMESATGDRVSLQMIFAVDQEPVQPAPVAADPTEPLTRGQKAVAQEDAGQDSVDEGERPPERMTFQSIYRSRYGSKDESEDQE